MLVFKADASTTTMMLQQDSKRLGLGAPPAFKPALETFFQTITITPADERKILLTIPAAELLYLYKYDFSHKLALRLAERPQTAEDFYQLALQVKNLFINNISTHEIYHFDTEKVKRVEQQQLRVLYFNLLNDAAKANHKEAEKDLLAAIMLKEKEALPYLQLHKIIVYQIPDPLMKGSSRLHVSISLPRKPETVEEISRLGTELLLASKRGVVGHECVGPYFRVLNANAKVTEILGLTLLEQARKMQQGEAKAFAPRHREPTPVVPEISERNVALHYVPKHSLFNHDKKQLEPEAETFSNTHRLIF